nr:hypothetical protein 7 [bacterium]
MKMKVLFFVLLPCLGCGGIDDPNNLSLNPSVNSPTGTISGQIQLVETGTSNKTVQTLNANSGVKVYVVGQDNLLAETDADGNFTIPNVPVGDHCIYSQSTSDLEGGDTSIVSECEIVVSEDLDVDLGSVEGTENSSYTCSTDADCSTNWMLPAYACNSNIASGSISSACGGFLCNGITKDDNKFCQYASSSSVSSNVCDNENESFIIHGSGPTGGEMSFIRTGPYDTCEQTYLCSITSDCPAGQSCYEDGYCISHKTLEAIASAPSLDQLD